MPGSALVIEAVAVEAIGQGARRGAVAAGVRAARGAAGAASKSNRVYTAGRVATPPSTTATPCCRATPSPARR